MYWVRRTPNSPIVGCETVGHLLAACQEADQFNDAAAYFLESNPEGGTLTYLIQGEAVEFTITPYKPAKGER